MNGDHQSGLTVPVRTSQNWQLSTEELAHYRTEGYLIRPAVFNASETEALRCGAERAVQVAHQLAETGSNYYLDGKRFTDNGYVTIQFEHESAASNTIRVIEPVDHLDPSLTALATDPRITVPMQQIIGTEQIAVWTNKLNTKRPGGGSGFGWHQDSPYWIHDCQHVDLLPNVMFAFDDATEANGCLQVIRRSHLQGCLPGTDDGTQLGGFYTSPACFSPDDAVSMCAPADSLIFFDPHCIHGSAPNQSNLPRRAMVLTYQPAGHPTLKSRQIRNLA